MRIASLRLSQFRKWKELTTTFAPLTLLIGPNGSGKTSLLEALFFLSRKASFNTKFSESMVQLGASFADLSLTADDDTTGLSLHLGARIFLKKPNRFIKRVEGDAPTDKVPSRLVTLLISKKTIQLFTESPKGRRAFLDQFISLIDPEYPPLLKKVFAILQRRQWLLKSAASWPLLPMLDSHLAPLVEMLTQLRKKWIAKLEHQLRTTPNYPSYLQDLSISFVPGWPNASYESQLKSSLIGDKGKQVTQFGPHKADFIPQFKGTPLATFFSQGELKKTFILCLLAQSILLAQSHIHPVLLIDDLMAELDTKAVQQLMDILSATPLQSIISSCHPLPTARGIGKTIQLN